MRLRSLLAELEQAPGPITGLELADRLGLTTSQVAAMLDALRAAGRLGPEIRDPQPWDGCSSAASCSMTCPGPNKCALTVNLDVAGFEIRRPADSSEHGVGERH